MASYAIKRRKDCLIAADFRSGRNTDRLEFGYWDLDERDSPPMSRPALDQHTINSYVGDGAGMLVKRALGENASAASWMRRCAFSSSITASTHWNTPNSTLEFAKRWTSSDQRDICSPF